MCVVSSERKSRGVRMCLVTWCACVSSHVVCVLQYVSRYTQVTGAGQHEC